jgi:hypothetical protein
MKSIFALLSVLVLSACSTLGSNTGFTCMASETDCATYLRTSGAPERSRPLRPPDSDFTAIHSNHGSVYIYRQGNTYWVNDQRR